MINLSLQTKGSFADPTLAGNIGGGLLKAFAVTFDYGNRTVYFEPVTAPEGADREADFDRAGLWMNRSGDAFVVVDVYRGGPAEAAGLAVGDRVLSVNGKDASAQSLPETRRLLRTLAEGSLVSFEIERVGARRTVAVRLRRLV